MEQSKIYIYKIIVSTKEDCMKKKESYNFLEIMIVHIFSEMFCVCACIEECIYE